MDLFKDLLWDNLIEAAVLELFAAFPFLAIWPLSTIIRILIGHFSNKLYAGINLFIDVSQIHWTNDTVRKEYDHRAVALKIIAVNHGIESREFKDARTKHKADLSKFIRHSDAA